MRNWDIRDEIGKCQTDEDYEDAKWVCNQIKIPFIDVNFVKEYWNNVFCYLTEQYESGYTPNPDILCNKYIKFEKFFNFARNELQADVIATGHYARTSFGSYLEHFKPDTNVKMLKAQDSGKDQTFFLCHVSQQALRYTMFPLGNYWKSNVKQIAQEAGLDVVLHKKESTGICFVGKRNFQNFISMYLPDKPGDFIDLNNGQVVGKHMGFHYWTIGQNIKLPTITYFVYRKDIETNNIIVVGDTNSPALYSDFLISKSPSWISSEPSELNNFSGILNCNFRCRHRYPLMACTVHKTLKNELFIQLSRPLRAIAKGQFSVFYKGEECLGGAVISHCGPSYLHLKQKAEMEDYRENDIQNESANASM